MKKIVIFTMVAAFLTITAVAAFAEEKKDFDTWPGMAWSSEKIDKVMDGMKKDFDILLKDSFYPEKKGMPGFPLNMWDDKDNIYVEATVPGRDMKDINVNIEDGQVLKIEAKGRSKEEEKDKNYYRAEFYVGDLSREIRLPYLVDTSKVLATYEKGILKLTLPKKEKTEKRSVKIEVK